MGRQLTLKKKTGFRVTNPMHPVVIRDGRGILFFTTEPVLPRCTQFNLPEGNYIVDTGYITEMESPVKYPLIPLPFPQRIVPKPDNFMVLFKPNKNKCTISWDQKTITFDTSFREKPMNQIFNILFHEFGHSRYNGSKKGEACADLYAINCMLKYGFNPMQCGNGNYASLSSRSDYRKRIVLENLLRYVV